MWCLVPFLFQRKNLMSYCTLFHQHHKSVVKCTLSQKIISLIVTWPQCQINTHMHTVKLLLTLKILLMFSSCGFLQVPTEQVSFTKSCLRTTGLYLCWVTDIFNGFLHCLQPNGRVVPRNSPCLLLYICITSETGNLSLNNVIIN